MHCPSCEADQPDTRSVCTMCGEVFVDVDGLSHEAPLETPHPPQGGPSPSGAHPAEDSKSGVEVHSSEPWIHLCVGGILAGLVFAFPIIRIGFDSLVTLVHEMGHAAFGWLFGRLSIPGFDFRHGGGVTMIPDQTASLLLLIYAGFAALLWIYRRNRLMQALIASAALVYAVCAHTRLNDMIILFMGHGTELVIAGIFLYRSLSGKAVINPLERPLYAVCGWFILFRDTFFAFGLLTDHEAVLHYRKGKGGHAHDFVRIAEEFMQVDLGIVAGVFLLCCVMPLAVSILLFCRHDRFQALVHRLTSRG